MKILNPKRKIMPKKLKKILKEDITPPVSKRFCLYCEKNTIFKYNRMTCHSCCVICGSHFSKKFKPELEEKNE